MGIQVLEFSVEMGDQEVRVLGPSSQNAREVLGFGEPDDQLKILLLRGVEAQPAHDHDHTAVPVHRNLIQEQTVIVADAHPMGLQVRLQDLFDEVAGLRRTVPLELLLREGPRGHVGEHLDRKRGWQIIQEQAHDLRVRPPQALQKEVR